MIQETGKNTGDLISPYAERISIISDFDKELKQHFPRIEFKAVKNYLIKNGVRAAFIDDQIEGLPDQIVLDPAKVDPEKAFQLTQILVSIFEDHCKPLIEAEKETHVEGGI